MKKIFLFLIFLYTFSFALDPYRVDVYGSQISSSPEVFTYNGHFFKRGSKLESSNFDLYAGVALGGQVNVGFYVRKFSGGSFGIFVGAVARPEYGAGVYWGDFYEAVYISSCPNGYNQDFTCNTIPTCTSTQELINNVCVEKCPSGQELINNVCVEKCPTGQERIGGVCVNSCNQMIGEFRKSDGTCQNCTSYTNFSSRAFCACDSQGTTYTPQALVTTIQTNGNYQYSKTNVTCDDGLRIVIYTDPVNLNPQDYNSTLNTNGTISPDTNHTTTPTDTNSTYTPPVQTNNDVVEAIKATNDISKEIKGEIGKVATDVKSMNEHLAAQGTTFNEVLASIKANGTENAKSNQLPGDIKDGQAQFKNTFGQWVNDNKANGLAQIGATNGVKTAVDGTTNAVNNQGKNITDKLDEVIKAIKEDGNGTSLTDNNNTGKDIDLNETNKKLDTLHDDNNKTHTILSDIKSLLDFNASKYTLNDMLPAGGEGWFTSNALKLNFNSSSGNCYCQQAHFSIAGHNFVFPPQEALDVIPFSLISNIFMAFIYVLGLKNFLKS